MVGLLVVNTPQKIVSWLIFTYARVYVSRRRVRVSQAVYRSGYISCGPNSDEEAGFMWNTCMTSESADRFSFELKKNDGFVLEQLTYGVLPPECSNPDPPALTDGGIGDIFCSVSFALEDGDTLTPTWYEVSHDAGTSDNHGTLHADIYGYVERVLEEEGKAQRFARFLQQLLLTPLSLSPWNL